MRMVFRTCPQESADNIADAILKDRLAAYVNVVLGVRSKYWWEGQLNTDSESLPRSGRETLIISSGSVRKQDEFGTWSKIGGIYTAIR